MNEPLFQGINPDSALLIVDDEEDILFTLKIQLKDQPYRVLTTSEPEKVLDIMNEEDVRVVLADLRMPGMNGSELLSEVRAHHPTVMRLIISAHEEVDEILEAINSGHIYSYLKKPWNLDDLILTIRKSFEMNILLREREDLLFRAHKLNGQLIDLNNNLEKKFENSAKDLSNIAKLIEELNESEEADDILSRLDAIFSETVGSDVHYCIYREEEEAFVAICHSEPLYNGKSRLPLEPFASLISDNVTDITKWLFSMSLDAEVKATVLPMRRRRDPLGFILLVSKTDEPVSSVLSERVRHLLPLASLILKT